MLCCHVANNRAFTVYIYAVSTFRGLAIQLRNLIFLLAELLGWLTCYSEPSDSGLSRMRTQYNKPLYEGHDLRSQYNSYNTL